MLTGPNLKNKGSVRHWPKRALSLKKAQKRGPQISSPPIQTSFKVFCVKIKLCVIFKKGGRVRKPDVVFV